MLHKLKINLHGEGESLHQVFIPDEQRLPFESLAQQLKLPVAHALIDPYFYHRLRDLKIQSWTDLQIERIYSGLVDTPKSLIEIWYMGRKVAKFSMRELTNELLLFPLYQIHLLQAKTEMDKGFYIQQKEIGLVGSYELQTQNFSIDDLQFIMIENAGKKMTHGFLYEAQNLKMTKKDTLLTFQNGFKVL
jgi:hypothetical protein